MAEPKAGKLQLPSSARFAPIKLADKPQHQARQDLGVPTQTRVSRTRGTGFPRHRQLKT